MKAFFRFQITSLVPDDVTKCDSIEFHLVHLIGQGKRHYIAQGVNIMEEFHEIRTVIGAHNEVESSEVLRIVITQILV